ncbi:response regulator [Paenibacillus sedimenti]|uniref:Response regulator n=1 Tax=Paenibacillus sedimenti TaxID=2770274 RepID=A0A926QHV2_9BACL|nr:response regulator [Paenibacillus sedimenti]MBD0378928.1 response regulator [Paenibacillus sedimenti]
MLNAMIVEDNAIYRYAIKTIIRWEDYGFRIVSEALNGSHALGLLQHHHVDLIVTDITMPEMNGIDLIQNVKRTDPAIKIVALSSYDDFRFVKEALKLGAEDYLLKHDLEPAAIQKLLQQMRAQIMADQERRKKETILASSLLEMKWILGRKLLFGELKDLRDMEDQAAAIHFPVHDGPCMVLLAEGRLTADECRSDLALPCMIVPITERKTAVIYSFPDEKSERKCAEEAQAAVLQLYARVKQRDGTLTVGISSIGYGLKDLAALYGQAQAALHHAIYEGLGKVYTYSTIHLLGKSTAERTMNAQSLEPLITTMKNSHITDVEKQIEVLFQKLGECKLVFAELRQLLIDLYALIKALALEKNKLTDQMQQWNGELLEAIDTLQPLVRFEQLFLEMVRQVMGSSMDRSAVRWEIQLAIAYIHDHYAEDVTVAKMAEVLNLSTNYLSNLFKNETGMRIIEYMNRFRIQKAKQLLRGSTLKVYEVAERTGFQETSYFCKVFKELEGKTVKDYRSSMR